MTQCQQRINDAVAMAAEYGDVDGAHHKQWVINQMLLALLADGYEQWLDEYNTAAAEEGWSPWDEGRAP